MTNERTARMMGDPPYRADAYSDVATQMERELDEQRARVAADQNWRSEWRGRVREELVSAKPAPAKPAPKPPTVEQQVVALWDAETPIGVIAEMSGLSLGRVYEIVSA